MNFSIYDVKVNYRRDGSVRVEHLPSGHTAESRAHPVATMNYDTAVRELMLEVETDPALPDEPGSA